MKFDPRANNRLVPGVSQRQAEVLRLARDAGRITRKESTPTTLRTIATCERHRYLAPRGDGGEVPYWVITDGGRAALKHYDAYEHMEQLWRGPRGH